MISRRHLVGSAAAALLVPSFAQAARAATGPHADFAPRGRVGRWERLPELDLQSRDEFLTSHRIWLNGDLKRAAEKRAVEILRANGLKPSDEIPLERTIALMENDPVLAQNAYQYVRGQQQMWRELQMSAYANADALLSEMEANDNVGPGRLELNPSMHIPRYAAEEIHNQPGGYVGDPFAGYIYYHGTNNFWMRRNDQDEMHKALAMQTPVPADGKVRRILDMGCGDGRLTMGLKERFPDAEVWGIDVGGPMVRFAHTRANQLGNGANFAQRLAEDTKFPDGHFDIVTSFLLFHEVSGPANKAIMDETARILRPGGVFYPIEIRDNRPKLTGYHGFWQRWNTRWNYEVWMLDHVATDYPAELTRRGFTVSGNPASRTGTSANIMAVRGA
jgi:ubiquinone/menaquinone biosynthesis C-methylase UbiE